jgi:hypothetical protein
MGLEFLRVQLIEGRPMLLLVLRDAATKMFAGRIPIRRVVGQGVEFVIPHDGQGVTAFNHRADDFKHSPNLWSPVDEVAEEDHPVVGTPVRTMSVLVAEEFEELHKFISVAVNVADQVVHESLTSPKAADSLILERVFPDEPEDVFDPVQVEWLPTRL